jgi:hydrogenase maturation factor
MCLGTMGVVTQVWEEDGVPLALVDTETATETVCLLTCAGVEEGMNVLVHLGFVVEVLDPASAEDANRIRAGVVSKEERP